MMHWLYSDVLKVLYVHILSMATENIYPNKKMTGGICSECWINIEVCILLKKWITKQEIIKQKIGDID